MKHLLLYSLVGTMSVFASCSGFLDTYPHNALSPATTWKTEADAESFVVGCYDGAWKGADLLYFDCGSDIAYANFPWDGFTSWGNGSLSPGDPGASYYDFSIIRRCNTVLENIDNVEFTTPGEKEDLIAEVKAIRAFSYFGLNWFYGGVPIIASYESATEAQVPRASEAEVRAYIAKDLEDALADIKEAPAQQGRIGKGAVLAIKMREALYYGEWEKAAEAARNIMELNQYELEPLYADLFRVSHADSREIILAEQHIRQVYGFGVGHMYNNADGGWSSIVPTQNLIDMYEMANGLTKEEPESDYDPVHPFAGRDPRMAMSVLYPGQMWGGKVLNTLDEKLPDGKKNPNYPLFTSNASKTSLTWAKYLDPAEQYEDPWDNDACVIIFRYAEVLLTRAEAENELNGPSAEVYDCLDRIRIRAGMPAVDRGKYGTKETLRELIHRERTIELAGEGFRRADILRWKDADGKMVAETVLNGELKRITGTIDYEESDPYKRAVVTGADNIEIRVFQPYNRYLPIPQEYMDKNPQLTQNPGYPK